MHLCVDGVLDNVLVDEYKCVHKNEYNYVHKVVYKNEYKCDATMHTP